MRLPEFTAEAALDTTRSHYQTRSRPLAGSGLVHPAGLCDADCLNTCLANGPDCWELPRHMNCAAAQKAYRQQCRGECCR